MVNPQAHTLVAAVVGSSLASASAGGRRRGAGNLFSLDGFGLASRVDGPTAAVPGVVLCVADGIVRIAAGIIRATVRLSGGINLLIGVTAGEDKRYDHDRDAEPHGRFPTNWSRPGDVRLVDAQGKSAIARSVAGGGDLVEQLTLSFNSMRRQK